MELVAIMSLVDFIFLIFYPLVNLLMMRGEYVVAEDCILWGEVFHLY